MSVLADIFASVHLNLETGEFEANAAKAADSAGASMGKRLSSTLSRAAGGAIGAGVGVAFGIAAKGAADLDRATQQLVADTGLVGPAAQEAGDQIASLYRGNLQGFDQIGAALAKVHTDLGLTGQAAGDTTGLFLKFSTATGQDAAGAVAQADDTLDAFNLTADHSQELLDKLIISHQRWGGSISENEAVLAKVAPALDAFGLGLDDGIALLNMFNAAGIDASKVPTALAKALKAVKTPAELKALIKDISDTKDPFERAKKAIELFGAKAGPQLAQALAQGNLSDFTVSMTEAEGATNKAADAVESGWGARFQLLMHQAGGALAEFGSNFGPLLLVAGTFGPKMIASLGAGLGGLAGFFGPKLLGLILPQAIATGTAAGTATGGAFGTALAGAAALAVPAIIAAAIAAVGIGIALGVNQIAPDLARQMNEGFFSGLGAFGRFMRDPFGDWRTEIVPVAQDAGETVGVAAATGLQYGLIGELPAVHGAVVAVASDALRGTAAETRAAAFAAGTGTTEGLAAGITAARAKPVDAMSNLVEMLKHPLSKTHEFERLAHQLVSKDLARGLTSADPAIRAAAQDVKKSILERMAEMKPDAGIIGKDTTQAMADGLRSKSSVVRANAMELSAIVVSALADPSAATKAGETAGAAYAAALAKKVAARLSLVLADILAHPQTYADRPGSGEGRVPAPTPTPTKPHRALGGPVSAGMLYRVNELQTEFFRPAMSGTVVPLAPPAAPSTGNTYQVNVQGLLRARDPFEVATQLRRLSDFGVLTPRREPA